jgi:hypothetical protein
MPKVGGEVDASCSKCELTLAHTIIAMVGGRPVKVECNTCHTVHRYREPAASPRRPSPPRAPREKKVLSFDDLLRGRSAASARRYSPRDTYAQGQVIEHPSFGTGFVSALRDAAKIEVTFRSAVKTLVHGRDQR